MKRRILNLLLLTILSLCLVACNEPTPPGPAGGTEQGGTEQGGTEQGGTEQGGTEQGGTTNPGGDVETGECKVNIKCESGTNNCYKIENNTITFSNIKEDSVYSISGELSGNIIIDVSEEFKFDLELEALTITSSNINPILIMNGNEVGIKAKKDTVNYIYDKREAIDETDETLYSGAIHSLVDLEIGGKGKLIIVSDNNNGIHTKDNLQVKNLDLSVTCLDNALKGNDGVEINDCKLTLIASVGDGIKTTNSDISSKGNQRGVISINNAKLDIYAACDGIDASYDVIIDGENTNLNIYTDKYSNYSDEVTDTKESEYYVRFNNSNYKYSIMYYNSSEDYLWVDAEYSSTTQGGRDKYYYYTFPKKTEYNKLKVYMYTLAMESKQEDNYYACTELMSLNDAYDTIAFSSRNGNVTYNWTNYTTSMGPGGGWPGGPGGGPGGGMQEGNSDKGDHSTKGIKAANQIDINNGLINIKSYDDAIHANIDTALENGNSPKGNVNINGGTVNVYSNDDGIHADGTLTINNGILTIENSYEGLEGSFIEIKGGTISINSNDDGINSTATSGTGITISGGVNYIYCKGDGIDSNSRTSYAGIHFSGGFTTIISNSNGNSSIDSEQGYKYTGGYVLAIMPSGGMSSEATHCANFSSVATKKTCSLNSNAYLSVKVNNEEVLVLKSPTNISGLVIFLGNNNASLNTVSSSNVSLDNNGVYWK